MRYHFIDEIVSLALDGTPRIEVAKRFDPADDVFGTSVAATESGVYIEATPIASARLMFVCVEPTAVGLARGPGA